MGVGVVGEDGDREEQDGPDQRDKTLLGGTGGQVWSIISVSVGTHKYENISVTEVGEEYGRYDERESHRDSHS